MARDSRLWQNSLAAGIVFEGDQVEALQWVAWAKNKLHFMLQSTPGATSGTFVPDEGVTIRIDTRPNLIRISVRNTIYMESGFLLLGTVAKCAETTFIPAKLYNDPLTNAKVGAYIASSQYPLEGLAELDAPGDFPDFPIWAPPDDAPDAPYYGKGIVSESPSKTMGGAQLVKLVQDLCGNTYEQVNPSYGDQDMYLQKACQRFVPSSLYSGKLRLLVQALYGSTRRDYKIRLWGLANLPASYDYKLVLVNDDSSETVFEHQSPTTGLFTTEDYEYFLMDCSVSSITFRKLRISKVAIGWLKILKTHPLRTVRFFANRVEAYALSTARIDLSKAPITLPTNVPSGAVGGPMGYGFKFKWDGSEIRMVIHEIDGYAYGINISRTVTVKIQYDTDNDEFTLTGQLDNTKTWANDTYHQFWAPDWFNQYASSFGNKIGGLHNTIDCPMYGYYDSNDQWIEFSIGANVTNQTILENLNLVPIADSDFPGYGLDDPVGLVNFDRRSCTNAPVGSVWYKFGGVSATFDHEVGIDKTSYRDGHLIQQITPGDPVGTTPTNPINDVYTLGPLTLEYGDLMAYLLSNYPYGSGHWGWHDTYPNNGSTGRYDLGWDSPEPLGPQTVWSFKDDGSAGKLTWPDYKSYSNYTNTVTLSLLIPFNDSESFVYGHHQSENWDSYTYAVANHAGALRGPQVALMSYSVPGGLLYPATVTSLEILNVRQQITTYASTHIFGAIYENSSSGDRTSTRLYYISSTLNGYTFVGTPTTSILLNSNDKRTGGYPSWAQQFFLKAAPYPDLSDYHPVALSKSSVGGATRVDMDLGTFSYGYPTTGVYSAIGWV